MRYHLGRTLRQLAVTIFGIVTVAFFLMRAIPGDPALYMLGDFATDASLEALRARLGLDLPVWQQYLLFVERAVTGDLGRSVVTGRPALDEMLAALPWSLSLAVTGLIVAVLLGVPLGIISAIKRGTWVDVVIMFVALLGISFPVFWMGLAAILLFSHKLGIFPALGASTEPGFWVQAHHLVLPAIVLGLSVAAYIARLTRSAMLEVLGQDYIRVARTMGVPEKRIYFRLGLRNALVPILAVIGVTFAWSLGNAILVEVVFSRPGLGSTILKAVLARDYQLVQAGVLILAAGVVLINVALDHLYGVVDPRLRQG
ncbi:ABC transporter permease [Pikeienuella piscinae]|uniref:ABC transporter permease n=1 Tax=Pikeienuella piscinae TaxID=2748098 RepID=A0A7L5C266_9RHOB|nr:ABC transporter permease [Pikeienuella piscinae]QIE56616.1 ABC transporter permease [Pikeienuella piscinae]